MKQNLKRLLALMFVVGLTANCAAFSLLGPFDTWQVVRIGYNPEGEDIGGPMNINQEYRRNVRTVFYGFENTFTDFFGPTGVSAVDQAFAVFNALTNASMMSSNLNEYPMNTLRYNYQAQALGLLDLKSITMAALMEQQGVASSERYTWTLRARRDNPQPVVYTVIKRNFDPVAPYAYSSYVNGVLYTYSIEEFTQPDFADAVEIRVDPLQTAVSVADTLGGLFPIAGATDLGSYFTGLTRDDVGALRFLYHPNNQNIESLPANSLALSQASGGSVWTPVDGTTTNGGTATAVNRAIRPGVDKVTFVRGNYDSILGAFVTTITNAYTDQYYDSNNVLRSQSVARVISQPDILFRAEDLGLSDGYYPFYFRRTVTSGWINNGLQANAGPGQIDNQVVFSFSNIGPFIINSGSFLDEFNNSGTGFVWGSYDGTTNEPVVYPNGSIHDLAQQIQFGSFAPDGSPWTIPNSSTNVTTTAQ